MYTKTKSTLTSVGFAYTEVVPKDSTPNPDDDTEVMSFADKYGGAVPKAKSVQETDNEVCLKTTRYILK